MKSYKNQKKDVISLCEQKLRKASQNHKEASQRLY